MAGVYNVYLKNLGPQNSTNWDAAAMTAVATNLKQLFDDVCQNSKSAYSSSACQWDPTSGTVKDTELLVYVLNDSSQSLIAKNHSKWKIDLTKGGNTFWVGNSTPRISEVYLDTMLKYVDANILIAKLAFHELMHNKLEAFDVHSKGGGGLATGG